MAKKINAGKMEEVAGGVRLVPERQHSGGYRIALDNRDELEAYNSYLKNKYGKRVFEEEDEKWTIDDVIKENTAAFNSRGRLFVDDYNASKHYNEFKDYCSKNGLGITFN